MASTFLSNLERRSWRMTHRDGLMDVLFGFLLLGASLSALATIWGLADWVRILSLCTIQCSGLIFIFWMRKREVAPRIGRVKFSARRMRRTRHMRIFLAVCVSVTVLLVVLTALSWRLGFAFFGSIDAITIWLITTAVIMVPIGALAVYMDYPRLLIHGSLFVIAEFCLLVLGWDDAWTYGEPVIFGVCCLVSFGIGIPIFIRFLRSMPRIAPQRMEGEE